jgi:hypothetical protein
MLRRVALEITDVSEEPSGSIIMVTRIGELGTTLVVTSNRRRLQRNILYLFVPTSLILVTQMMEALSSFEASVFKRATRCKGGILHSHRRENLKSYIAFTKWGL